MRMCLAALVAVVLFFVGNPFESPQNETEKERATTASREDENWERFIVPLLRLDAADKAPTENKVRYYVTGELLLVQLTETLKKNSTRRFGHDGQYLFVECDDNNPPPFKRLHVHADGKFDVFPWEGKKASKEAKKIGICLYHACK